MEQRERPQPDELVEDLAVVVRVGTTVAAIKANTYRLPGLLCCISRAETNPWEDAIAIHRLIVHAVIRLGNNTYATTAALLFGVSGVTRGLSLGARRRAAARELGIEAATLVRHREDMIVLDVAVELFVLCLEAQHRNDTQENA